VGLASHAGDVEACFAAIVDKGWVPAVRFADGIDPTAVVGESMATRSPSVVWSKEDADAVPETVTLGSSTSGGRRYELLERKGWGGMGEVWIARDRELNREVLLKQVLPRLAENPQSRGRFLRETRTGANLYRVLGWLDEAKPPYDQSQGIMEKLVAEQASKERHALGWIHHLLDEANFRPPLADALVERGEKCSAVAAAARRLAAATRLGAFPAAPFSMPTKKLNTSESSAIAKMLRNSWERKTSIPTRKGIFQRSTCTTPPAQRAKRTGR
jgi:hypothetical protein